MNSHGLYRSTMNSHGLYRSTMNPHGLYRSTPNPHGLYRRLPRARSRHASSIYSKPKSVSPATLYTSSRQRRVSFASGSPRPPSRSTPIRRFGVVLFRGSVARCGLFYRFFWFHKPTAPPSAAHERFAAQLPFFQARYPQLHGIPHGVLRMWHGVPRDDMGA